MRKTISTILGILALIFLVQASEVSAQQWAQCTNGESISRCETYNCPRGDTNDDGACTLDDSGAELTDSRRDAFCSNPFSGCGEVRYYTSDGTSACLVRVKESGDNCDLYNPANPEFTPVPTVAASSDSTGGGDDENKLPEGLVSCQDLTANPFEGKAPLDVRLTAETTGEVSQYEFRFGDETDPIRRATNTIEHTYSQSGVYTASVRVSDEAGSWFESSSCRVTITARGEGEETTKTKGGQDTEKLPETGPVETFATLGLLAMSFVGYWLYTKFKLA